MAILIVEDERKLSDILKRALKGERYSVAVAHTGKEGLEKALKGDYTAILLDVMLPEMDGFAVCRELRKNQIYTPIIMITAKGDAAERVVGLDSGADDYLVKPFGLDELFARIRAVSRRGKAFDSETAVGADIELNRKSHEVTRAGKVISLTPKEYKLLEILLSNQGEAVDRRRLIDKAWGPEFEETNNELNVHIRYLRKKIDGNRITPLIQTIRGVGFILKT